MSQFYETCLGSRLLTGYIHHYAYKLHRQYPRLLEREDGEQELWSSVFRAIKLRYTPERPLIPFAKRAVFSHYGSMIRPCGTAARRLNERTVQLPVNCYAPAKSDCLIHLDKSYKISEANFTLDRIAEDLESRASAFRQYHLALQLFKMFRNGQDSMGDCCKRLNITSKYGSKIFNTILCGNSEKYLEGAVTIL